MTTTIPTRPCNPGEDRYRLASDPTRKARVCAVDLSGKLPILVACEYHENNWTAATHSAGTFTVTFIDTPREPRTYGAWAALNEHGDIFGVSINKHFADAYVDGHPGRTLQRITFTIPEGE